MGRPFTFTNEPFSLLFLFLLPVVTQGVFDYRDAVIKSLLYFEAQRSGHLPYNQRVTWRGHSGLTDGLDQGVDLVGGYYDAGDHVKFGLPMAFTITMLAWSTIEYADEITESGEFEHVLEAIKWGTDYFIKAHTHPNVFWAQVGDGSSDHYCWQRPEDMTTPRRAYKIDAENPGSEVVAETAAALAAASILFRKSNPHYSHLLLHHAQQLFEFGDKYREKYDKSLGIVKGYYPSTSGYGDELLWAGFWLYKATRAEKYLDYVIKNAYTLGGAGWKISEFSWDIKYAGVQVLAAKLLVEDKSASEHKEILNQYKSKAEFYLCSCLNLNINNSNVHWTPSGLLYIRRWNNMQYVVSATFLLTVYSDYLQNSNQTLQCPKGSLQPHQLLSFAKSQVDYILGSNPMNLSYLIGFGSKYPNRVHHRAASTVTYKEHGEFIGCSQGYDLWFGRQKPNPNVLTGAIVGGPDLNDEFRDVRGNFMQTEACTYNTAPMVGVFAKFFRLEEENGGARLKDSSK
ncbi:endoglucanase 11-like [Asparagus officinalis]|nr:endoglucanase 11-like [Asparagus officinalis]